jgi:hypothetical protein
MEYNVHIAQYGYSKRKTKDGSYMYILIEKYFINYIGIISIWPVVPNMCSMGR